TGYVTPYGRAYDAKVEALATLTGHRIMDVDVAQSLRFKGIRFNRASREATTLMTKVVSRSGTVSAEEIGDAVSRMERARRKLLDELHDDTQAAIRQGMTWPQVASLLREVGISQDATRLVLNGEYQPYRLTGAARE